ncbi:MAG TPA: hypothetical protein VHF25_12610 [Nitriliruptorales bacterium]|nr:hypothetical protein [Nitriliruptorales bacterium]
MAQQRGVGGDAREPTAQLGRGRAVLVRAVAVLGLLTFSFMLVFVANDAAGRVGQQEQLVPAGSREAQMGADRPGEAVHITGAVAAILIGASGLAGLIVRPRRAGSATQTVGASVAMLLTVGIVGDPDNYGGQASPVDLAFVVMAVPPLAAGVLAAPWRAWRPVALRRPRLLLLAALASPGLWYGFDQGMMQRNTWPPLADPHHQAHWYAMSVLAFLIVVVVAGAALAGRGWRVAAASAGAGASALALASLLSPASASALHPLWAIGAALWGLAVLVATWDGARRSRS